MNVNHEYKAIWWLPQRTASRAVSYIPAYYKFFNVTHNVYVSEVHDHSLGIPKGCEDYLIICNVRNPFAHVVSQWHWRCFSADPVTNEPVISCSFSDYVRQIRGMSELESIFQQPRKPDIYFRIENYMEDLEKIPFINMKDPELMLLVNSCLKNNGYTDEGKFMLRRDPKDYRLTDWRSYYSSTEELDIIRKVYKIGFEEFGYDPNDV